MAQVGGVEVMKALAHPLRQRILRHLRVHGPATSTTLAQAMGENTGTLSYHLRQLERGGLIEDVPEQASGRERWWRGVRNLDLQRPQRSELTSEEAATLDQLDTMQLADDMEQARRYIEGKGEFGGWAQGSRSTRHMTEQELADFRDAYVALLQQYGHAPEDAPAGARPILLRWFALPVEPDDGRLP